jgi:hypothetical protein
MLEAKVRAIEGVDLYDPIQVVEMCMVLNVVVLKMFRTPNFINYTETQCLITHLKAYCNKMAEVMHDEKLLIHFFQENLSMTTLSWYIKFHQAV